METFFQFHITGATCGACMASVEQRLEELTEPKVTVTRHLQNEFIINIRVNAESMSKQDVRTLLKKTLDDTGLEYKELYVEDDSATTPDSGNSTSEPSIKDNTTDDLSFDDLAPRSQRKITLRQQQLLEIEAEQKKRFRKHLYKGIIGTLIGAGLIGLMFTGIGLPLVAMAAIAAGSSALTLYLGTEFYLKGAKQFKSGMFDMDTLFALSTLTIVGVAIAGFFVPWLPMMMETGVLIFGFRHLGIAIEQSIKDKVNSGLSCVDLAAKKVRHLDPTSGRWSECLSSDIKPGDLIRVAPGEIIPVDGIFEGNGDAWLDTTSKNGESTPSLIKKTDQIFAGMLVPQGMHFEYRAKATVTHSELARMDQDIEDGSKKENKAPIELTTRKLLKYFVPSVIALAIISGLVIGILFNPALAIQCAASLLVAACPCTLGLITPVAIKIGMVKASKNGVHFKTNKSLQQADAINTVVLDLNGTLTTGELIATNHEIYPESQTSAETFFTYLAALENAAPRDKKTGKIHPFAERILSYASSKCNINTLPIATNVDEMQYAGVKADINDECCLVGNAQFLARHKIELPHKIITDQGSDHTIYLVRGGRVIGHITIQSPLRKDAKFIIEELQRMGKEIHICTGSAQKTAEGYIEELGLSKPIILKADHYPRDKTKYINGLINDEKKRVAMVGDGINDSSAIAASHFGIAVNSISGNIRTQDAASAVIDPINDSLLPVVTTFAVAKQTMRSIKQNLVISLAYNMSSMLIAGGVLVAVGFTLNPAIGVALMVLQVAFILLNQYRIRHQELPHIKRHQKAMRAIDEKNAHTSPSSTAQMIAKNGLGLKKNDPATVLSPRDKITVIEPSKNDANFDPEGQPTASGLESQTDLHKKILSFRRMRGNKTHPNHQGSPRP